MEYKSSKYLFSLIKQDLSSYDSNNLIDEGSFYRDVKHVINQLGLSIYDKKKAVIKINSGFKGDLPIDFAYLDSVFKCSLDGTSGDIWNPQLGNVIREDIDCEEVETCNTCSISCEGEKTLSKITVRTFIKGIPTTNNFTAPVLLKMGNVSRDKDKCAGGCPNLFVDSPYFFTLDQGHIITNFKDDYVYMNYFAFPLDQDGMPMIPDDVEAEQAIEYYIKAKIFENLWVNGDDPNVEKKFGMLQGKADEKMKAAMYKRKIPEFNTMMQTAIRNRRRFSIYNITSYPRWGNNGRFWT